MLSWSVPTWPSGTTDPGDDLNKYNIGPHINKKALLFVLQY